MARIAVTGAAGSVGRQALRAFDDHEVVPVTHREHEDIESRLMELTDPDSIRDALRGCEVVVHLAGNPSPDAEWESVSDVNVDGTRSVFEAALDHDVERVVFASTNHVMQMHSIDDPSDPESMRERPGPVTVDDRPRPDSFYAVSKVAGEALGSYYADRHGLDVVNLRIGWLLDREGLRERQERSREHARYARAMWLSPHDCRDVIRRAATHPLDASPVTVNAVSRNQERTLSLIEALRELDYRPRDDSSEVLDGD